MRKKTSGPDVATRRLLSACAVTLLLAAACSGPTSPTTTPPVSPTVPAPPPATAPPLSIACPANVAASITGGTAVAVTFDSPRATGGVAPVSVSCTRQSGSPFTVGQTTVQCTAVDSASASSSCTFTVTVTALVPRLTRTRFLAFGDSMTAGEITVPATVLPNTGNRDATPLFALIVVPSASYPTQLQNLLRARYTDQMSAITVVNSGVPGEWAQDGAKRLPGVITAFRPEAVLLLEGYNDLGAVSMSGILAAALAIDTMAKEIRNRGARVFLATLPPPGPGGAKGIPASQVVALNDRIRVTARGEGAVLVDVHAALVTDVPRYVGVDGLHLTELGYQRVAELFFDAIRTDLEVR